MTTALSLNGRSLAKQPTSEVGSNFTRNGDANTSVSLCLQRLFGAKAWAVLMSALGISEGAARKKTYGERNFSLDELRVLLHREDGFEVLSAMMTGSDCRWFKLCRAIMDADSAKCAQAFARRKISAVLKGALDADQSLAAAIQDAETALVFHDENFHRPHRDAVRAMAGVSNRPVAQTKGTRR
jgi:hypothetical protein